MIQLAFVIASEVAVIVADRGNIDNICALMTQPTHDRARSDGDLIEIKAAKVLERQGERGI